MGKFSIANLKKTIYYFQRNGLRNTWNAARERLSGKEDYKAEVLTEERRQALRKEAEELLLARQKEGDSVPFFSILVPAYRTDPAFLRELLESVKEQVYPNWELLILDATEDGQVRGALGTICSELSISLREESLGAENNDCDRVGKAKEVVFASSTDDSKERRACDSSRSAGEELGRRAECVRYVALSQNAGISENTNAGLAYVEGDYIGLLDHDDVLTADALYEMTQAILGMGQESKGNEGADGGLEPYVLYSDEDKWDGENKYYELNRKEDFNLDLLLSNNYICHFLVMKTELFKELRLRKEYDGAQDYDLVLRAVAWLMAKGLRPEEGICHVPKVLYHWRCHSASTAENPRSKTYAYEAGKRALQDFADGQGWDAATEDLKHVGFYRLRYRKNNILQSRPDLGAVGGKVVGPIGEGVRRENGLVGGRMAEDGSVYYEGLKEGFSGYLHRGVLTQDAEAVDIRCICVQPEFRQLFEQIVGVPYVTLKKDTGEGREGSRFEEERNTGSEGFFDAGTLPSNFDVKGKSIAFCKALREQGKRVLWDPDIAMKETFDHDTDHGYHPQL